MCSKDSVSTAAPPEALIGKRFYLVNRSSLVMQSSFCPQTGRSPVRFPFRVRTTLTSTLLPIVAGIYKCYVNAVQFSAGHLHNPHIQMSAKTVSVSEGTDYAAIAAI